MMRNIEKNVVSYHMKILGMMERMLMMSLDIETMVMNKKKEMGMVVIMEKMDIM